MTGQRYEIRVPLGHGPGSELQFHLRCNSGLKQRQQPVRKRQSTSSRCRRESLVDPNTVEAVVRSLVNRVILAEYAAERREQAAQRAAKRAAAAQERQVTREVRNTVKEIVSGVIQKARAEARIKREQQQRHQAQLRKRAAEARQAAKLEKERGQLARLVAQAAAKRVGVCVSFLHDDLPLLLHGLHWLAASLLHRPPISVRACVPALSPLLSC